MSKSINTGEKESQSLAYEDCELGECSTSCGQGFRNCERICLIGQWGDPGCPEMERIKEQSCDEGPCQGFERFKI